MLWTEDQREKAHKLLRSLVDDIIKLSQGDKTLVFALMEYKERGNPAQRRKMKSKMHIQQKGLCTLCGCELPTKGAEFHRTDTVIGDIEINTVLICHTCHDSEQEAKSFT
jgi:hypothetical protein